MKKGFTLIELMIVIIIIGVLATIGIVQYQAAVEKSRGAEAKSVIGFLRSSCAAKFMETGDTATCIAAVLNLGTNVGSNIPSACAATNFFNYSATPGGAADIVFTATRCAADGKSPDRTSGSGSVTLTTNYTDGSDSWSSSGGY